MKKYRMMFYQADTGGESGGDVGGHDGGGLGGSIFEPPPKQTTGDRPLPQEKADKSIAENDPQTPPGVGTVSAPTSFDPAKFAKEFGASVAESLKGTVGAPKPPDLSPEEARKLLNIWEPDEGWYRDYDNLETRGSAVEKMRDGLVRQADTLAQLRMQEALQLLRDEIGPQLSMIEEHTNAQRETRFYTSFQQLSNPALQPLISAVTENLVKQGKTFTSESEMFKAVADGVAAVIQVNNPDFKLETAGSTPAGRNANAIPVTSPGSGGGTGASGTAPKASTKRGIAVFD